MRFIPIASFVLLMRLFAIQGLETRKPLPEALMAMSSSNEVTVTPDRCNATCINELRENRGWIEFTPVQRVRVYYLRRSYIISREQKTISTVGFIFYPGAKVDVRAYAVYCSLIAKEGYLVANVPMPDDLASNDRYRGYEVIRAHPEIKRWIVGGHSLGGQMAAYFANKYYNQSVSGLFNTASYFSVNISQLDLIHYSIYGSRDGILNKTNLQADRVYTPNVTTSFYHIYGANHGDFAYYIDYNNTLDLPSLVSREEVHNITTQLYFKEFMAAVKDKYNLL